MNLLNGAAFKRMESAVYAAEMRQRVISNNVANAETPYFKRSEVLFEQLLEQSMGNEGLNQLSGRRTDSRHIPIGANSSRVPTAEVVTDQSTSMNNNQNNVDVEREMSLLAKNQLSYNFYIQQINHDIKMMRTGIEGRS
ncbi:flagellar basal body rod protein FlgB [Paenibacillus sp. GSMTC-2017]|uniref:flagellar basal body rod protein FlgB n=1 Tax=Paenibacillus sp. GSMTC-2017 TaxID=2794350 RepID=UPI0018D7DEF5|nr:flagellar basal body rod protein FlgB [Paenibacillus sp. GSMTC-2017]MBH5316648.1 flagellar basal body rod protein FlgB [Paenibacillus sp. GSMTC-2017]